MADIDDDILQDLYTWVDQITLSRPKKNIVRDFSDGVLMAEVVKTYFPKIVDLHNFQACHAANQKKKNWQVLNWKVFKKLNFELSNDVIESIINCKPGTVERVLLLLRSKMDSQLSARNKNSDQPEADQGGHYNQQMIHSPHYAGEQSKMAGGGGVSHAGVGGGPNIKKAGSLQHLGGSGGMDMPIPRLTYEEKVQECLAKDETIEILQAKIRRLEHLLHLKDVRIDELQSRMDNHRPTGASFAETHHAKKAVIPRVS